jgi:nucleoside-diphosphate-sugar epimerase
VITGERILVTGVTGSVGRELAMYLAEENEVWGLARFAGGDVRSSEHFRAVATPAPTRVLSTREELEAAGVTIRAVDLGSGAFDDLPTDFTYVVHLAWLRADLDHLDDALRANVEGAGLLLQHCRRAKAALVMSGMGVYSGNDDPWWAYSERDPVGRGATAYAPTSPACKLGLESVARFCARAFDLPVVITRLNTLMGSPGTFPGMHIDAVMRGGDDGGAPRSHTALADPHRRHEVDAGAVARRAGTTARTGAGRRDNRAGLGSRRVQVVGSGRQDRRAPGAGQPRRLAG